MSIGVLTQNAQERLNDATGAHSFRVFRERHDARKAWEFYVLFKTREGKAQRVDAWVNDPDTEGFTSEEVDAYVEGILINAIRETLEKLDD